MRTEFFGVLICGLAVALVSCSRPESGRPSGASSEIGAPLEDRSLNVDQYVKLGMPSPDRLWTPPDYAQAIQLLQEFIRSDIRQLPRHESANSGILFARMVSPENLSPMLDENLPLDARMPLMVGYLEGVNKMLKLYMEPAARGMRVDVELVEIMGLLLKISSSSIGLCDRFMASIPKDDPKLAIRQEGLDRMKAGIVTIFTGGLVTLNEPLVLREKARLRLCGLLRETLPNVISGFPPTVQQEFSIRLKELEGRETNHSLKAAISDLRQAISQ